MAAVKFKKLLLLMLAVAASFILKPQSATAGSANTKLPYPKTVFTVTYERNCQGKFYPHCKISSDGQGALTIAGKEVGLYVEDYGASQPGARRLLGGEAGFQIYEKLYLWWYQTEMNPYNPGHKPLEPLGAKTVLGHHCRGWLAKWSDPSTSIRGQDTTWFDLDSGCLVQYKERRQYPFWAPILMLFNCDREIRMTGFVPKAMTAKETTGFKLRKGGWSWFYSQPPE